MRIIKSPAIYCLKWQLLISVPVALGLFSQNGVWAYSFVLGAVIFILTNLYFTAYAFRFGGAKYTSWVLRSFNWGESGKFVLSALGFALVFKFVKPLAVFPLFVGFTTMVILQWFVAARVVASTSFQNKNLSSQIKSVDS